MALIDVLLKSDRFKPGAHVFHTPARRKRFTIKEINREMVKVRVEGGNIIRIPAACFNESVPFLSGKDGVFIGSRHGKPEQGTFDHFVQKYTHGVSAASYVAPILEEAKVLEIDGRVPNKVRLLDDYRKLVRDKIPNIIERTGQRAVFHKAGDEEYYAALLKKIREETSSLTKRYDLDHVIDLLELAYALGDYGTTARGELEMLRKKKGKEQGTFNGRIMLDDIVL